MLRAGAGTLRRARTSPPLARAMSGGDESFDVVIVGGGVMGSAAAFFLSQRMDPSRICVVERDMTYSRASSPLSVGSIRQQFSVPENIRMSLYGAGFLRDVDRHLRPEGDDDPVDVQFHEEGYLFLATPETRPILEENYATQRCAAGPAAHCDYRGSLAGSRDRSPPNLRAGPRARRLRSWRRRSCPASTRGLSRMVSPPAATVRGAAAARPTAPASLAPRGAGARRRDGERGLVRPLVPAHRLPP